MSTLENWSPVMYQAMNSTTPDGQPLLYANSAMALYFMTFVCLCVFFILNLVISVAIDHVSRGVYRVMFCSDQDKIFFEGQSVQ